eukprot:CAMPEP_0113640698 /NCGR_PEP_ID=MMETSP0017_2-20120614/21363_1 /TAXON_ID=2856 /ORGANISM="Cylindrotheca closterium" /LENGTH=623 /DNA_ID=CAMNT_0000551999 /DNA_START=33 /DNA_END=1901 /DNA_ORIENTATION=- /assembly_acc=CAM_ASM_000147
MASMEYSYNDGNKCIVPCLNCNDGPEQAFLQHAATLHGSNNTERPEMKQTEDFLASEMNKLSVQERANALADVHCVGEELKETPEMIEKGLAEFQKAVEEAKNPVYEMACQQNRSYVEDPTLRLQFLRANFYDVGTSVRKMMNVLQYKAKYFGHDMVARDITLDDLNEEEMELILSGLCHIQDGRDRSGRVVLYVFTHMLGRCRADTLIRAAYYVCLHIIVPIPEVQTKGAVVVFYDLSNPGNQFPGPGLNFAMETMQVTTALPIRNSAMHFCLKPRKGGAALSDEILRVGVDNFSRHERVRTSLYFGSDLELRYHLRGRGIPTDTMPVGEVGNLLEDIILNSWFYKHRDERNKNHLPLAEFDELFSKEPLAFSLQSLESEEMVDTGGYHEDQTSEDTETARHATMELDLVNEEELPSSGSVAGVQPRDQDVMLGKGKSYQNHPGNVYFRAFLEKYLDDYDKSPRHKRRHMCANLAHMLKAKGVRFIVQQGPEGWVECDSGAAEKKIGQLFRSLRKTETARHATMKLDLVNEEELPSSGSVARVQPRDQDVMLGKGKSYQNHPGNVYFRTFLEQYLDNYDKAPRQNRRPMCANLANTLRAKGVRFIEQQEGSEVWVECDLEVA